MHTVGWVVVGVVAALMIINGSVMLISPRAWFRLPSWLRAQGTLTEDRYAKGWGAVQVRIAGGLILGSIAWVVNAMIR